MRVGLGVRVGVGVGQRILERVGDGGRGLAMGQLEVRATGLISDG